MTYLSQDFARELRQTGIEYSQQTQSLSVLKWKLAKRVNEEWQNHKGKPFDQWSSPEPLTKQEYMKQCTLALVAGQRTALFGESGETLRKLCSLVAYFEEYWQECHKIEKLEPVEYYVSETSFEHLEFARQLHRLEKVKSPFLVLQYAMNIGELADSATHSADECWYRFNPSDEQPTPAEKLQKRLAQWSDVEYLNKAVSSWQVKPVLEHVLAIKEILERKSK